MKDRKHRLYSLLCAAASLTALFAVLGCSTYPPTVLPEQPRRGIQARSYKMKLAVLNFVDQTGSAGKLIQTIPDVLATELFNTGRFEIKERAELREFDANKMDEVRERYKTTVDAFLVGSITRFSTDNKTMTLDVRAMNAANGTVMYAGHHEVHYEGVLDVKTKREDISAMSTAVFKAFPTLGGPDIKVASVSGDTIRINVGEKDGVKTGMGILIASRGDTIRDPVSGGSLGDEIFVGEAYVVEVSEKAAKASLVPVDPRGKPLSVDSQEGRPPMVRLYDSVRFK